MLTVLSPEKALELINYRFAPVSARETLPVAAALGRVLAEDIVGGEFVPGFDRSTVDGYALRASDSFGCSEAIPAILELRADVAMGREAGEPLEPGCCAYVPTGAALPEGADAVAMIEYSEAFGDGTVAINKAAAPGENIIFKGDDVFPGKLILRSGHRLGARDMGSLASLGVERAEFFPRLRVGIISTGDELVNVNEVPGPGQVRDINSLMLSSLMEELGHESVSYGIVRDEEELLSAALDRALAECDGVLISGGSSVGVKDATARIIESRGEILFHGLAIKPGKPTILGKVGDKPVFGLPGHPAAAWFVSNVFVRAALDTLRGRLSRPVSLGAKLTENVSANHGRAQYVGVSLSRKDGEWIASPIRSKSGLISSLPASDGFFCIPRDSEGCAAGEIVEVCLYETYQEI